LKFYKTIYLIFRNGDGWEEGYYEYDYEAEGWYQVPML
jgi:hypothetical protein